MPHLDPFTQKRLLRFIEGFRGAQGELPSLNDLAEAGFDKEQIKAAIKASLIEEFYVTLTNGSIIKGYKIKSGF